MNQPQIQTAKDYRSTLDPNWHGLRSWSSPKLSLDLSLLVVGSFIISAIVVGAMLGCGRRGHASSQPEKPARVEAYPNEPDIYRVILTPKAEERLQVRTVPLRRQAVPRHRTFGGQIVIPDGQRIVVTSPLTGTLLAASNVSQSELPPAAGVQVSANQRLFELSPVLRPDLEVPGAAERVQMANARAALISAQVQALGECQQAEAQVVGARITLARTRKLLESRAGSQRAVDDAEATLNVATKGLEAARQRRQALEKLTLDVDTSQAANVVIRSPTEGIVQTVSARTGQVVSAGAPLLEIVDLARLWVRVPVYAGQQTEIDANRPATLTDLSQASAPTVIEPVAAPPTADPLAASIDLYYSIPNGDRKLRPGERVFVQVPLRGETESLVVPRGSILRDIHGVAWVYVRSGEHEFRRSRVDVEFNTKELAVLASGPAIDSEIVVDGAAEIFGTEFGAGK